MRGEAIGAGAFWGEMEHVPFRRLVWNENKRRYSRGMSGVRIGLGDVPCVRFAGGRSVQPSPPGNGSIRGILP